MISKKLTTVEVCVFVHKHTINLDEITKFAVVTCFNILIVPVK